MTEICQCKYPCHRWNHVFEKITGEYINTSITFIQDDQDNSSAIAELLSLNSFVYGYMNRLAINEYEKKLPNVTNEIIRHPDFINEDDITKRLYNIIELAPKTKKHYVVYRGMHAELLNLKVNSIMIHYPFLWTTRCKPFAKNFVLDTSNCYGKNNSFSNKKRGKKEHRILFEIHIPPNIPYIERYSAIDFNPSEDFEILFQAKSKLKIMSINYLNSYTYIVSELFPMRS